MGKAQRYAPEDFDRLRNGLWDAEMQADLLLDREMERLRAWGYADNGHSFRGPVADGSS